MIERILSIFAPHRCCSCGTNGAILCESCKEYIEVERFEGCVVCRKPNRGGGICSGCKKTLPVYQAWCVGDRKDGLKQLLDAYKFKNKRAGASLLADLLGEIVPILPPEVVLMSVPTLPATVRVRGFDHTGLIVQYFAKRGGLKVVRLLERKSQATLHFMGRIERQKLGPGLFSLRHGVVVPKHVLLVDDILTTGTTARAAANLLLKSGAERVDLAIIARQPER